MPIELTPPPTVGLVDPPGPVVLTPPGPIALTPPPGPIVLTPPPGPIVLAQTGGLLIPRLTLRLAVDFDTLPDQDLLIGGDGIKTFAGFNWTANNTSAASTMAIVNGTGLVIACNTTDSSFSRPVAATAPNLEFNTLQLLTPLNFANYTWLAKAALDHNADASLEVAGVGWRSNGSNAVNWALGIGHSGSSDIMRNIRDTGTVNVNRAAPDRIVAITSGSQGRSCSRKVGADVTALGAALPVYADLENERFCSINVVATASVVTNRVLLLFAASGNTDGNFVATFRRLELYALDGGAFP